MFPSPNHLIRRTVQRFAASRRKVTLLSLPNDTLVDLILVHLCVRDILRLRSVCRLFYELTHQPMVWKRILRKFHLPLPPLPPTTRYSFPALSSLEAERLVTRALAAEANWRSTIPKAYKAWIFCVYADILSMKIVPGGKYIVVSVREGTSRYSLMLLMMEHRVKTAYPVAKIATSSKAYKIEAKYMRIDVSDYSEDHAIDYPVPVRYELNVIHCPLSAVHIAEDPRFPPGSSAYTARIDAQWSPFNSVTTMRSNTAFDFTDLDALDSAPYIVIVQGRNILFKNLISRNVYRIRLDACTLLQGLFTYDIRAIRILAFQRELLVVRTDRKDASMPLALELYKIPRDIRSSQPDTAPAIWPRSVHTIATGSHLTNVTISAVPSSTDGEDATAALTAHSEPPAVSVFVVMRDPWHTVQFRLWPERIPRTEDGMAVDGATPPPATPAPGAAEGTPQPQQQSQSPSPPPPTPSPIPLEDTTFRFQLYGPFFKIVSYKYSANAALGNLRILAGTTRPLLVGTQADDRRAAPALHDLWAYADLVPPPLPHARWPEDGVRRAAGEAERGWVDAALRRRESPAAVAQLALPPREVRERFSRGLSAIEWDDWSMSMYGHRFPIPVPDVDERFRTVSEDDPFEMSSLETASLN
ncbi:hypothetical protein EDB87DRAFT_1569222 [Lactarius vividus]|nr:hypothetical protein EDB87DRAFT_1569222 [Lactarius vividus]